LGEYIPNPNAKCNAFGDVEYLKLVLCNTLDEIKIVEFLENKSAEMFHHQYYINNFGYIDEMTRKFTHLPADRQVLLLKLSHSSLYAYNKAFLENLDPKLKEKDPAKWEALDPTQVKDYGSLILCRLSDEQWQALEDELNKSGKIQAERNFKFDFDSAKRSSEKLVADTAVTTRFKTVVKGDKDQQDVPNTGKTINK